MRTVAIPYIHVLFYIYLFLLQPDKVIGSMQFFLQGLGLRELLIVNIIFLVIVSEYEQTHGDGFFPNHPVLLMFVATHRLGVTGTPSLAKVYNLPYFVVFFLFGLRDRDSGAATSCEEGLLFCHLFYRRMNQAFFTRTHTYTHISFKDT